jgi:hypothetical protein
MLQFNFNLPTNTNAVWIDQVDTTPNYYDDLLIVLQQQYDLKEYTFEVTTKSTPNSYRRWLIFSIAGNLIDIPSGQYSVKLFTSEQIGKTWGTAAFNWIDVNQTWSGYNGVKVPDELIYSDRAYVEGNNVVNVTQYVSPNEQGKYITYNG